MIGRMKSGTEGWVRITILDYSDIVARTPMGVITRGGPETYRIRFEEGKHRGEIRTVPANYVQILGESATSASKPKPLCAGYSNLRKGH